MSTQTSDSAVGPDAAAVAECILAPGLDAQPPSHFPRAGSGKSNLTWPQPGDAVVGLLPIVEALVRQAQFVNFEERL